MIDKWLNFARSVLYPATCVLCGGSGDGNRDLCKDCLQDLPEPGTVCYRCAEPLPAAPPDSLCGRCLNQPPAFDRVIALCEYAPPLDHLIHQLKFSGRLHLARLLGELLAERARRVVRPDCILPMPLHATRLRQRGFNQAMELARPVARTLAAPLDTKTCIRIRATPAQSKLSRTGRQSNVKGAFAVQGPVQTPHIAIVDDVMTTGSTAGELARALKSGGAQKITVIVVARAL